MPVSTPSGGPEAAAGGATLELYLAESRQLIIHEWWPILAEARLYDRLAAMPVSLRGAQTMAEQGT